MRLVVPGILLPLLASVAGEGHWAFEGLKPGKLGSIDAFIRQRLEAEGLEAAPRADGRTLARRLSFGLTGLPPWEGAEAGVETEEGYARLVDRLLASPHYGEQWARHWLDVARYSDTKGYVYAREEKNWVHAAGYRDWVARALNEDMGYDRFLLLQLAADQVEEEGSPDLVAMGFLTLGRRFLGVTHDIIDDRIDVVTRGMLGLTVACARCHDHKSDPIPTRDYYALYGVFQSSAEALVPCGPGESAELAELKRKNAELLKRRREEQMARTRARAAEYTAALEELEKYPEEVFGQILEEKDLNPFIVHKWRAWKERNPGVELTEEVLRRADSPAHVPDEAIANIEMYFPTSVTTELWKSQGEVDRYLIAKGGKPAHAMVLVDRAEASEPRVFLRGNPLTKGEAVPRRFLSVFGEGREFKEGSGRLELARAITGRAGALAARVMVNRIWQHHFGRGLVDTPSDFGKQGGRPSHAELLDWLAERFVESGWSVKAVQRLIVMSETYRQRSWGEGASHAAGQEKDPENRLLWRMNAHRLSFEEARDAWLAAGGGLDLRVGGWPEGLLAGSNRRRTLYARVDRENVPEVMRTFDFANPDLSIPQRTETTVPQQALFGMNHPFVVREARGLLAQLEVGKAEGESRVRRMYARLLQREPDEGELAGALAYAAAGEAGRMVERRMEPGAWQYGVGEWDEEAGRVKGFKALPHFTGSAWQGAEEWPNRELGWAQLTATGGHPGNDLKHAVVRRWVAPAAGRYDARSTLIHEPEAGDGIRGFVGHSRLGKLRSAELRAERTVLDVEGIALEAGEWLDFVVDIGRGLNNDQFLWAPQVTRTGDGGVTGAGGDEEGAVWDAARDFAEQPRETIDAWEQLAQVLMLSNEFMFVD